MNHSNERLYPETAKRLSLLKKTERSAILRLIKILELGVNFSKEFTELLSDLSKILDTSAAKIIGQAEIQDVLKQKNLPRSRKTKLIKDVLLKLRYPTISAYKSGNRNNDTYLWQTGIACQTRGKGRAFGRAQAEALALHSPSKRITFTNHKGTWLKRCPGTPEHICCNYLVINNGMGCPFNCTYCYLQTYMNQSSFERSVILYKNSDSLIQELEAFFEKEKGSFRIGTGEFTDSLALDGKTGLSQKLIKLFAGQEQHLLELKTKSTNIDHLLDLDHRGKIVFSWTLNPEILIKSDEQGTASLKKRLEAAKKCAEAGYKISFHFDPLIHIAGWQEEYQRVVDQIFEYLKEEDLTWISLGALRFLPKLKNIIEERFPQSTIMLGEFVRGTDGKMRYFEPIRVEMFRKMIGFIRNQSKKVFLYLCMESPEVWKQVDLQNQSKNPYARYFRFTTHNSPHNSQPTTHHTLLCCQPPRWKK